MRRGLFISIVMHVTLLAWAVFTIHKTSEFSTEPEAIAVAMITPSELLRLKQGSELSKQLVSKASNDPRPELSQKEAEKPKPRTAPSPPNEQDVAQRETKPVTISQPDVSKTPPPDPIAQKITESSPETQPEQAKTVTDQKLKDEEQKKAEEKKKTELEKKKLEDEKRKAREAKLKKENENEKKKQEANKKAEVSDRLAALLDKDPTKRGAPESGSDALEATDKKGPTAGSEKGTDTVLSLREQDLLRGMLRTQIARCWRLPGGGGGTETPIVTLRWRMRPDGTLNGDPQVEKPASGPLASLATEAAIRAVTGCQPYDLPQDLYANGWQEIIWEFDPSQML